MEPAKAHRNLEKYGLEAEVGTDFERMLRKKIPDFVLDLTPLQEHCRVTFTVLEAGCHIHGEKPMTDDVMLLYWGSWCAEGWQTSWNGDWRYVGDEGTVICERDQTPHGQVVAGGDGFLRDLKDLPVPKSEVKYTRIHGVLREMLEFPPTGKSPRCQCGDNIKSLAMLFAVIESSKQGQAVSVEL